MFSIAWLLDLFFPPRRGMLRVRTLTLETLQSLMTYTPIQHGTALLPYRHPDVRAVVTEAKYRGDAHAFMLLAGLVEAHLGESNAKEYVLVPIPLSKKRVRERGYNQIEEVLRRTGLPYSSLLRRVRDTKPQTSLGKQERVRNMQGAFTASPVDPAYLYIVVDDVATTGATLRDAVRALKCAGAGRIRTLSFST